MEMEMNMEPTYLNQNAAHTFLTETLHVDWDNLEMDRLDLLTSIVSRCLATIPFHNIHLLAQPPGGRHIPSLGESIQYVLDGSGGTCDVMNTFMYFLLQMLQFDVDVILCSVVHPDTDNHMALVVRNLVDPGDKWLVDPGFGAPSFHPVALDFEQESPTFTQSYLTYKYIREGDKYIRLQKVVKAKSFPVVKDGWAHAYYFTLTPRDLGDVRTSLDTSVYQNTSPSNWFQFTPRLYGFGPEGRAVIFRDNAWLLENEKGELDRQEVTQGVTIATEILHRFPGIPGDVLKTVLTHCNME